MPRTSQFFLTGREQRAIDAIARKMAWSRHQLARAAVVALATDPKAARWALGQIVSGKRSHMFSGVPFGPASWAALERVAGKLEVPKTRVVLAALIAAAENGPAWLLGE